MKQFRPLFFTAAILLSANVLAVDTGKLANEPATNQTVHAHTSKPTTVNGVSIQARIDAVTKEVINRGQAKDTPELRNNIRDTLIDRELLSQEATKKNLDKRRDVQQALDMAKVNIMANAAADDYISKHPISDATMRKKYDEIINAQFSGKEYHAYHILVKTEAEADQILTELKKGKKFEDLAKQKSMDKDTAANGGDLGWSVTANYAPEFAGALEALAKGKVTEKPVKTKFGYHIIRMDEVRDIPKPPFDEVKQDVQQILEGEEIQKLTSELRSKASIQ